MYTEKWLRRHRLLTYILLRFFKILKKKQLENSTTMSAFLYTQNVCVYKHFYKQFLSVVSLYHTSDNLIRPQTSSVSHPQHICQHSNWTASTPFSYPTQNTLFRAWLICGFPNPKLNVFVDSSNYKTCSNMKGKKIEIWRKMFPPLPLWTPV